MRTKRYSSILSVTICALFALSTWGVAAGQDGPKAPLPPEFGLEPTSAEAEKVPEKTAEKTYKRDGRKVSESADPATGKKTYTVHRRSPHFRQFRDPNGTLTLTNRPEKYRGKKGYVELSISYEPIIVAPRYKKLRSAKQYNSGAISDLVKQYAKMYALDEKIVHAVIAAESGGNPYAVSSAGARGLMQLMPETAAEMGVTDIFDPAQNIAGGTQYLAKMLNLFDNKLELALAAYNAGPNAVKEHGGIPPYPETQAYVRTVCASLGRPVTSPVYAVKSRKPSAGHLPGSKKGHYLIHFASGYTQPADKIVDEDPYYYVQFGNRSALVKKTHVAKIDEPA